MSRVYTGASTSIDGYVSGPDFSGFEHLFKWFSSGDVEVAGMRTSQASADYYGALLANTGAGVVGRTLYDHTGGWGGTSPVGSHTVVLTHRPLEDNEHFTFCTEGIERAVEIAREHAGDKDVVVNSGQMARQALDAGLLEEICLDLVPVILGGGTPFFAPGKGYELEGPLSVVEGVGVTHLRYKVRYGSSA
ncbi:dihydrofolate reductase [Lentzea atacamensis]|uniref:Dihydrofolate reductase n=2 Tax=Lentzea TaxID=165301 RepID=A0A316I0V9_9PSEU|nr:dihydrofolate reductase family protein [Lentzea atacamensis]PWK86141.1 dihydrofolate reductase [Lentzea atacamensis]